MKDNKRNTLAYLSKVMDDGHYGSVIIRLSAGVPTHIVFEQALKPQDLSPAQTERRG